jgi:aryl-phospho-beta-D-glucosidase BglC (GH1 family)
MKTEILNIHSEDFGYRVDFDKSNGQTHASARNSFISKKDLMAFVTENRLNAVLIPDGIEMNEELLSPETFVEENLDYVLTEFINHAN